MANSLASEDIVVPIATGASILTTVTTNCLLVGTVARDRILHTINADPAEFGELSVVETLPENKLKELGR